MKVSYAEGVAIHIGPESCGAVCKGGDETLTGGGGGRVCSRERALLRSAEAVRRSGDKKIPVAVEKLE